ncbi:hypothetical protein RS9916_28504 [Synechococcus sp. RS9916]|nr:hypothetical protein RS9916_28504 [Synechococcus sp. RS9916]
MQLGWNRWALMEELVSIPAKPFALLGFNDE